MDKYKGLAIEGGGVAGVAYIGALKHLNMGQYTHFSGSSVGAILAGLLACRASLDQLVKALDTDYTKFKDSSWIGKDIYDFIAKYGWYDGHYLVTWYKGLLHEITGNESITFQQVYDRYGTTLVVTRTNVVYPMATVSTMDYESCPDMPIVDAIRMSASIPYFYESVIEKNGNVCVDGGVMNNYPIQVLYKWLNPEECMGLYLIDRGDGVHDLVGSRPVRNHVEFIESIAHALYNASLKSHVSSDDWTRTCRIDRLGVSATDFGLTPETRKLLIASGEKGMLEYIKSHPGPEDKITNYYKPNE